MAFPFPKLRGASVHACAHPFHRAGAGAALAWTLRSAALVATAPAIVSAQQEAPTGVLAGRVLDTRNAPVVSAVVHLRSTRYGTTTDGAGRYRLADLPAGRYTAIVRRLGFAADSFTVDVGRGATIAPELRLKSAATVLAGITVQASPRLNETREAALAVRAQADNLVVVQSGDEIRSLPNANAAEALARMPGVSTERDEGEGKFVQIRGTEPRLSNVTIDGAHVPGTESRDRVPKLDDVPSDLLGAVEVSETLTADMDADAIGGSVNLVTKAPEGTPRGYFALQGGQQSQLERRQGQWSLMYGGRTGEEQRLGFLLGVNYDRNNRSIEDVEPAWNVDGSRSYPVEWDQRDYLYRRSRTGLGGDLDYRFPGGGTIGLKGLFSEFLNYGTRYRFDAALGGDSVGSGSTGVGSGATFVRETSRRTPNEQMYGLTLSGHLPSQPVELQYGVNYAGTRQLVKNYRFNDFEYDGPNGNGVPLRYNGTDRDTPRYAFVNPSDSVAALTPSNFALTRYSLNDGSATGHDVGFHLDGTTHYSLGDEPSTLKFGVKLRDERKGYDSYSHSYAANQTITLDQVQGTYSDPSFYTTVAPGFLMGPQANEGAIETWEDSHPAAFTDRTNLVRDALGSYHGSETIYAGYGMQSTDIGALHVNVGLRAELTRSQYTGHVATSAQGGGTTVTTSPGSQRYLDLFPSAQLKYALSDRSDIRLAVTRGIARPNYYDLAPHLSGATCASCRTSFGNLSAGNPDLKPQHAWNFDLLGEKYLTRAGLVSAGVFYKKITGFIYDREFVYDGPVADFTGYYGTRPENGGDATLSGYELTYVQRFYALPGALAGLGVDLNWTHTDSRAALLSDTATTQAGLGQPVTRWAHLPRQAPNVANLAGTYELGRVSARAAYQFQQASIYSYGDGTPTPNGDTYFYSHGQVDASLLLNVTSQAQLQIQGLDLNNAVFGFYNGAPGSEYSIQREVYGRSFIVGVKYGF